MIDLIYKTVQTILNKDNQGYVSPREFNLLCKQVQDTIFRNYFGDENRDKSRQNRGGTSEGYSNLAFNQRQRIGQFTDEGSLSYSSTTERWNLPDDLYYIEKDGIALNGLTVIEEVQQTNMNYLLNSIAKPTELYPVYVRYATDIRIHPTFPTTPPPPISIRYVRVPKSPKWTYTVVSGVELYNPSANDFQDFELHESEFPNIVMRLATLFGINLRENEVVEIAEILRDKENQREEGLGGQQG